VNDFSALNRKLSYSNFPPHTLNSVAIIKNAIGGRRLAPGTLKIRALAKNFY